MAAGDSTSTRKLRTRPSRPRRIRRDGWTAERQIGFLEALGRTRSVATAAAAVGMSRESAYRLRARQPDGLFAALWDRVLRPCEQQSTESHTGALGDGRLARLLGNHFRRKASDFSNIGKRRDDFAASQRTWPL